MIPRNCYYKLSQAPVVFVAPFVHFSDGDGKIIHLPAGPRNLFEFLFCSLLELRNEILGRNLVHFDVKKHRRNAGIIPTAAVIIKAVDEMGHCLDSMGIIIFQQDWIFGNFLNYSIRYLNSHMTEPDKTTSTRLKA